MDRTKAFCVFLCALVLLLASATSGFAYSTRPEATDVDGKVRALNPSYFDRIFDRATMTYIDHFIHPVHEQVTHIIYGCSGDRTFRSSPEKPHGFAPAGVIAGVQWNDNPPFELKAGGTQSSEYVGKTVRLPNFSRFWFNLFKDAQKRTKNGEFFDARSGAVLLYRVHFGDMQFLHAMATQDGEKALETRKKLMMWAEFTYRLALGEINRGVELRRSGIPGMDKLFFNRGWTPQQLFTRGDPTFREENNFQDLAFGSLLHLVEDSFVTSHVERDEPSGAKCVNSTGLHKPGKIIRFRSYAKQDHKWHHKQDGHDAFEIHHVTVQPDVIDVGKVVKSYYDGRRPWSELRDYLQCVFEMDDPDAQAGP